MRILEKIVIADVFETRIVRYLILAPIIAANARPGQYVTVMIRRQGERIPLTIVDTDKIAGTITLIVQELGFSTKLMGELNPGDALYALLGPLGHPTEIKNYSKILIVGGGAGIAELYPVVKASKRTNNTVYSILAGRTKNLVVLRNEIENYSDAVMFATDDGTLGEKGLVTDVLAALLSRDNYWDIVYCAGPLLMMKAVAAVTKPFAVKTIVSLNAIMLDATGMCGCCRLSFAGQIKFCCVDGPDFDAHQVDFDDLFQRQKRFCEQEKQALNHLCKIDQRIE